MVRRVFFSFHYESDIFRVSQVRNSGVIREDYERAGFIDHADWESLERQGDDAIDAGSTVNLAAHLLRSP